MAVSTGAIVEHFDVIVDLGRGDLTSLVDALLDPLLLQTAKEGFGHCVIPAVTTSAHTGLKVMRLAKAPPRIAAKLRPLIRMNQCMLWLASPDGHEDRVQHEFLGHRGLCEPADNASGVEIHYHGKIEPAFPRAHVRNVGDPGGVRSLDGETSSQRIGRQEGGAASGIPGDAVAVESFQVIGPHNPRDTMFAAGLARFSQIEKDSRGTVDAVARRVRRTDEAEQSLILHRSIREGFMQPGIEPATRHAEETAHNGRIEFSAMGVDEGVLQSDILRSASMAHWTSPCANDPLNGVR